ncbi:alpha/beta fold hydrolase [Streptomyces sp. NPDC050418]|uniref:alpha/beta fold hydrolase n=1 Tax=Streptomyces sp. NPDC050418 TaxID=3365612 RepID=UPI0037AACDFB
MWSYLELPGMLFNQQLGRAGWMTLWHAPGHHRSEVSHLWQASGCRPELATPGVTCEKVSKAVWESRWGRLERLQLTRRDLERCNSRQIPRRPGTSAEWADLDSLADGLLGSGWRCYARRVGGVAVVRRGVGPEVLLVHGGAGPRVTWGGLEGLAARWTLVAMYRRGFAPSPSPPPQGRQDFEVDAGDVGALLSRRPHVVAHSYGVLGTLIAAAAAPGAVRSLTLIEPPLHYLVPGDPDVERLQRQGDAVLAQGMGADSGDLRAFLRAAGAEVGDGPLPEAVVRAVRRAVGTRPTGEARPRLDRIRDAGRAGGLPRRGAFRGGRPGVPRAAGEVSPGERPSAAPALSYVQATAGAVRDQPSGPSVT